MAPVSTVQIDQHWGHFWDVKNLFFLITGTQLDFADGKLHFRGQCPSIHLSKCVDRITPFVSGVTNFFDREPLESGRHRVLRVGFKMCTSHVRHPPEIPGIPLLAMQNLCLHKSADRTRRNDGITDFIFTARS